MFWNQKKFQQSTSNLQMCWSCRHQELPLKSQVYQSESCIWAKYVKKSTSSWKIAKSPPPLFRPFFQICIIPHANTHARHYCICIQSKRINKLLTYYCQNIAKRSGFWIKWIASNIHRILHIHLKLSMFARTKVCKMKACSVQINQMSKTWD